MLTHYQTIIKHHLVDIFSRHQIVSDTVLLSVCEKYFVIDLALEYGYIPAFGIVQGDYVTVNFIQEQPVC